MNPKPVPLSLAIRVFPLLEPGGLKNRTDKIWRAPLAMFVVDSETRTDSTQRLTFGSYRFLAAGELREEGLFHADDLSRQERKLFQRYVNRWNKRASKTSEIPLLLMTRRDFLKKFYKAVYKSRALLVGFNLPFDLSRLAIAARPARGRFAGGFSLALWSYKKEGVERPSTRRPSIGIKHIDSKRALKGFTARFGPDDSDLIPEDSATGQPQKGYKFRGHMLDLRTLAFAITDRSYSLDTACKAFGVEHGKQHVSLHGVITNKYIDYNRRDVEATSELAVKLLAEFGKHPISLQPTKAYSPASIGKAYLGAMRVLPVLERQPDFPMPYVGFAQTAFFGGRTSAHIRNVPVPVVYVDFLSMYPTVNGLMDLWKFVTARHIRVGTRCQKEIDRFLRGLTPDKLLNPKTWKQFPAFVKVIPNGDILPSRSKYSSASNDWQVAVNYLHASDRADSEGLWYSLPDVAGSALLTGKVPKIVDAFKLVPERKQANLRSVLLSGEVPVNPRTQDLFRTVIEQRKSFSKKTDVSQVEMDRLDKSLKVFANASSYGIYAEMNRQETEKRVKLKCQGIDAEPFECSVMHPEKPGEFCFPPLASLITGAARFMLALLEHCVTELGGTYAMEDTDSMAIVATKHGGFIPCPGGRFIRNGVECVKALSWRQVNQIVRKFETLNPYDRQIISGSVLKIEDDNFDLKTGKQRQIFCYAISAKRYALFTLSRSGSPELLRQGKNNKKDHWSRHGLGHLLNPADPEASDRNWTAAVWDSVVRKAVGQRGKKLPFSDLPAIGRTTVSSPFLMRSLESLNAGKPYPAQIKPFNFLATSHVNAFGHPLGVDPEKFHLISPYDSDSRKWLEKEWIDQHSGKRYRITTKGEYGTRYAARVKTYGELVTEYESHPEAKCADSRGNPCNRQTVGLLQRRHIKVDQIKSIGKESNSLESIDEGTAHSESSVYTEYVDPKRTEWITKIQPTLKRLPLHTLVKACEGQISRRELIELRASRSRPHRKTQALLIQVAKHLGLL